MGRAGSQMAGAKFRTLFSQEKRWSRRKHDKGACWGSWRHWSVAVCMGVAQDLLLVGVLISLRSFDHGALTAVKKLCLSAPSGPRFTRKWYSEERNVCVAESSSHPEAWVVAARTFLFLWWCSEEEEDAQRLRGTSPPCPQLPPQHHPTRHSPAGQDRFCQSPRCHLSFPVMCVVLSV